MTDYQKQATDFLNDTNTTLDVTYVRTGPFFGEDQGRDVYSFTLKRGQREYTSEFGQSLNCSGQFHFYGSPTRGIKRSRHSVQGANLWLHEGQSNDLHGWDKNRNFAKPTAYDILACLEPYSWCEDIDEFASEFGYDKPSEAIRVFEAVKAQSAALMALFNDAECEQLAEIA